MYTSNVKKRFAFTLVETVVVMLLAGVILLAVLGIYNRVRASAVVILDRLEQHQLQAEILQKIAEDIDRLAAPGFDATINFRNKVQDRLRSSQLTLQSSYYNKKNQKSIYEQIIWQTSYDAQSDSLILYRMHGGLNVEDKVLETDPESSASADLFIPVAAGVTYFEIKAQQGETVLGAWTSATLPKAVRVGISFAPLQELADGSIGVPEEDVIFRTIAVERTRFIPYQFVKKDFEAPEEPNEPSQDPNGLMELPDLTGIDEPINETER